MNPQFFGDDLDLFKYDLIINIMTEFKPDLHCFYFIPMMTRYCPKVKKGIPGSENDELIDHLYRVFDNEIIEKYCNSVQDYFSSRPVRVKIFRRLFFSSETRDKYFSNAKLLLPERSLIFLDPDTGLEPQKLSEKHLAYQELQMIYDKMDNHSILMVYQHHQQYKKTLEEYQKRIETKIRDKLKTEPLKIRNNAVTFFFVTKNKDVKKKLADVVDNYRDKYPSILK